MESAGRAYEKAYAELKKFMDGRRKTRAVERQKGDNDSGFEK